MGDDGATMLLIVGTVRVPPAQLAAARPHMAAMIAASRAEPSCVTYSYAEDVLDPGLIRVTEIWRDRAAFEAHGRAEHLATWRSAWPELGIGERQLAAHAIGAGEPA